MPGAIRKSTVIVSGSSNLSNPVATSVVVSAAESTPPVNDLEIAALGLPNVVPAAAEPAFDIVDRSPSQCANHTYSDELLTTSAA